VHLKRLLPLSLAVAASLAPGSVQAGRPLSPEDWFRFQAVSDLKISPDGAAVAYLVTSYDRESDESRSALWLADWAGDESVQLTRGESVSEPRFSPDGRYLAFVATRGDDDEKKGAKDTGKTDEKKKAGPGGAAKSSGSDKE